MGTWSDRDDDDGIDGCCVMLYAVAVAMNCDAAQKYVFLHFDCCCCCCYQLDG